jgi:phenylalanyl-tRNA synthetase beta subunit
MEKPKIGQLLVKLDRLLDRYVDGGPETPYFAKYQAFLWDGTRKMLKPIKRPIQIDQDDIIGIESIKKHVLRNTKSFIDGRKAGWIGELHPRLAREFELPRAPIIFELEQDALSSRPMPVARPLSRLPVVRRDLAIVVDDGVAAGDLLATLEAAKPPGVEALRLFDVYRGPGLLQGKKSLAILVLMQDTERTLTDADIDATVAELLRVATDRFGATLRQ